MGSVSREGLGRARGCEPATRVPEASGRTCPGCSSRPWPHDASHCLVSSAPARPLGREEGERVCVSFRLPERPRPGPGGGRACGQGPAAADGRHLHQHPCAGPGGQRQRAGAVPGVAGRGRLPQGPGSSAHSLPGPRAPRQQPRHQVVTGEWTAAEGGALSRASGTLEEKARLASRHAGVQPLCPGPSAVAPSPECVLGVLTAGGLPRARRPPAEPGPAPAWRRLPVRLRGHVSCDGQGPGSGSCASDPCGREGGGQAQGCRPRSWVALVAPDSTH